MTELEYFKGDELAASTWRNKYAAEGEENPNDTHLRMAKEFMRIEDKYHKNLGPESWNNLTEYGRYRDFLAQDTIFNLFKDFKYIIPGGSVMSGLGTGALVSLSNCFVIDSPKDSYVEIMKTRSQQAQLMKRRGGVGYDLSQLRPRGARVNNAAKSSTGAASFMDVCSDITNEVAQNGRRGALMLSMSINHPDIEEFITKKQDLTKVTGANISVKVTDEFMQAVMEDKDYILRYPVDSNVCVVVETYNELVKHEQQYFKKVRARELWNTLMHCAWNTAEPGIMFEGAMHNYSPDGVYPDFKMIGTNPCFHPDTLIETVEGKRRIADITEPTYVYSMSREGHICIVPATAAFKTKENAKTLKITLRNGSSIMITPEHKMFVQGVGFIEAQNLKVGDRIAHILRSRRGRRYVGVKLTTEGNRDYVMEHRLVYEGVYGPQTDMDIHHLDANTFNNIISNLQSMEHSEHARLTALEQNPQTHQVKGEDGRFIPSGETPAWVNTESLPIHLSTKCKNQWDNCIISIEEGEQVDVYDIQVPETHCLIANNMVAHNCGEIPMGPFDSCRLIHINLSSYIVDPFTDEAHIDEELLYMHSYEAMRLADDLIDLELEAVDRIINAVNNDSTNTELELWEQIKETTEMGRRAGLGFTALADAIAMLGLKFDSDAGIQRIEQLMKIMFKGQLDSTIDMAIERGSFPAWDGYREWHIRENDTAVKENNPWFRFLKINFPNEADRMSHLGRRNISWSTVAPTGTVSIMAGTSSGIEPVFMPFYQRKRKCMDAKDRVDYVDKVGEKYTLFTVVHPNLKRWAIETMNYSESEVNEWSLGVWKEVWKESPYYGSTAPEIDWRQRVKLQGVVQKYITHSISSTVNLAKETTEEEIADIYIEAWKQGLKGITIYRDGCREGVLTQVEKPKTIEGRQAPKRPKVLEADYYQVKVKKEQFIVLVGLLDGKPYEVFAFRPLNPVNIPAHKGIITKVSKMHYSFDSEHINIANLELANTNIEENAATLYSSMLLRHGVSIEYIIKTAKKVNDNISSFSSAMCRILAKYISNGEIKGEVCPDCGGTLVREGGCIHCKDCGYSKCL